MIYRLYDGAWSEIYEGLLLRADWLADGDAPEQARMVRELVKCFEEIGEEKIGGVVEGYRMEVQSCRRGRFEIEVRWVE